MKFYRHLFVEEVSLPQAAEWKTPATGWRFIRVSQGVAYWLSPGANQELATGGVIVLSPRGGGSVLASKLGDVRLHYFHFCPESLNGFFTLSERQHLESVELMQQRAVHWLPDTHPIAK